MLRAVTLGEFLDMEIPPVKFLLDPVLPSQGLVLLYAKRGVGKTHLALGMAYAVATGGDVLKWRAPRPYRVLYVDGEMSARRMQERLGRLTSTRVPPPAPDYFRLITPDLQEHGIPDLSTLEGQREVRHQLGDADLLVLDNLSTLCKSGDENEAGSWQQMQQWLLDLRSDGKSVLVVHHAGKSGDQRGTSRREDAMDCAIRLSRPDDYESRQGARFVVEYTKGRELYGADCHSFEAQFVSREDGVRWLTT